MCAWRVVEACDCTASTDSMFILLRKVILVLFLTMVSSSYLTDYANPLEIPVESSAHFWVCWMALQGSGCGQLGPCHFLPHPALH